MYLNAAILLLETWQLAAAWIFLALYFIAAPVWYKQKLLKLDSHIMFITKYLSVMTISEHKDFLLLALRTNRIIIQTELN